VLAYPDCPGKQAIRDIALCELRGVRPNL